MTNKERKLARGYDTTNRCRAVTSTVYSGPAEDRGQKYREAMDHEKDYTGINLFGGKNRRSGGRKHPELDLFGVKARRDTVSLTVK